MRYFIAAIILLCGGLSLSGSVDTAPRAKTLTPEISEIACEDGFGSACVHYITFPAMHIESRIEK